ncbi:IS481 family transposase [Desulfobacterota bacterium AH_259_B03_O07]|nr:IS481 family transposase [Desulfobacterota bacterium AH_259_B03_O07]
MEERARFVLDVEVAEMSVAELCRRYGVSRKTGHKWIRRYRAEGFDGIRERRSRPHTCPHKTSPEWEERMITERLNHSSWGPKKIRDVLERKGWEGKIPAVSTIGDIFRRAGLVSRRRTKRRRTYYSGPLTVAKYPSHVWAVDYKGWFRTKDGRRCEPLTIRDLYSRYVLEVRALPDQSYEEARGVFERVFEEYGLPKIIRSDNGGPFASRGAGGLSRLSVWWVLLGIKPEYIAKGHPEQNGVHERMHLTLKKEATIPASRNLREQERRFDSWRKEFNYERPHEALKMKVPAQKYRRSTTEYQRGMNNKKQIKYPEGYEVRRVRTNGEIKWKGERRFIGAALKGVQVGIKQVEDGHSQVYFNYIVLGDLYDIDYTGLRPKVGVHQKHEKKREKV